MRGRIHKIINREDTSYIVIISDVSPNLAKGDYVKIDESYSAKQMKFVHAMFNDIANQTGHTPLEVKDMLKGSAEIESVADTDKEGMGRLIEVILEFVREHDITLDKKTINEMDAEQHVNICL